ncbi:pectinesterase inhibitor 10-like [Gadus morhua]|uniref:pectinesterase inhibitor 10-like n=1 Tax=Gadus morhua TaxID=8049 RepID=UPI0011B4AF6B|nr:pectinesterase inhibitor 10-like [Gadus morhua]
MTLEVDLVLCALLAVSSSRGEASVGHPASVAPTLSSTPDRPSSASASSTLPSSPPNQTSVLQPRTRAGPRGATPPPSFTPPQSASPARRPSGPLHPDPPAELNVGDDAFQGPGPSSLLDPLLAGLVSVCVATAAVTSVVLCLRFRQQAGRPEFQRLQDVPMDDLMEDAPLSSYTY